MFARLVLSFGLIFLASGVAAQDVQTAAVLTVTGTGQISVTPDMATILVGVEVEAKTAKAALALNSSRMVGVYETLSTSGVAKRDVQTSQFSLLPQWSSRNSSPNKPPKINGYVVSNVVTVRVRALDQLGPVLDALTKSGANRIQAVQFGINAPKPHLDQARGLAVKEAMRKAGLYAAAAGVKLGAIVSISEGQRTGPAPYPPQMRALAQAVPVAEGELTLSATVTIRFMIE